VDSLAEGLGLGDGLGLGEGLGLGLGLSSVALGLGLGDGLGEGLGLGDGLSCSSALGMPADSRVHWSKLPALFNRTICMTHKELVMDYRDIREEHQLLAG
jgi:hypothetical protein